MLTVDALGNVLGVAEACAEAPDLTPPQPPAVYPGSSARIEVSLDSRHGALEASPWRITASDPVWGALYRQLVASGIITDRMGLVQYANPAFERTTGFHCDEVSGKPLEYLSKLPMVDAQPHLPVAP